MVKGIRNMITEFTSSQIGYLHFSRTLKSDINPEVESLVWGHSSWYAEWNPPISDIHCMLRSRIVPCTWSEIKNWAQWKNVNSGKIKLNKKKDPMFFLLFSKDVCMLRSRIVPCTWSEIKNWAQWKNVVNSGKIKLNKKKRPHVFFTVFKGCMCFCLTSIDCSFFCFFVFVLFLFFFFLEHEVQCVHDAEDQRFYWTLENIPHIKSPSHNKWHLVNISQYNVCTWMVCSYLYFEQQVIHAWYCTKS